MPADLRTTMKKFAPLAIDVIPSHSKVRAPVLVQEASHALPNTGSLYPLQAGNESIRNHG